MKAIALTLAGILIALIGYEWLSWSDRHRQALEVTATEGSESTATTPGMDHKVLRQSTQDYIEIADQTLFRSDRKGILPKTDEGVKQTSKPQLPKFRLLGVILTESEPPSAMIFDEKLKQSRTLHVGDALEDWKLKEIGYYYVVLSWRDQLEKIQLRKY